MIAAPAGKFTEMVGQYLMEQIPGLELAPGMFQAFMVVDDDMNFVAGVAFTNYRMTNGEPTDIEISCASSTPLAWRPGVSRAIFKYVFETVGCVRCTSITVKGNRKARAFLEGFGFQLEGNVRLGYDGRRDALIYGLLRSECRFLAEESEKEDGEKSEPDPAASARPDSDGESARDDEHSVSDSASEPQPD